MPSMARREDFSPFMDAHEVRAIEACLATFGGPLRALEWGSGNSTLYFAWNLPRGSRWRSIEHQPDWARSVAAGAAAAGLAHVEVHHVPNDAPFRDGVDDGDLRSFRSYVLRPFAFGEPFDFVLVDGRARVECLRLAWELLAEGGVLVLHDAQRGEYVPGLPRDAHVLRVVNHAVHSEGPITTCFAARSPERLTAIARALDGAPSHVERRLDAPPPSTTPGALAGDRAEATDAAPAPAPRRRCVFVHTFYPEFLRAHYAARPDLASAPYALQLSALQARRFGDSDCYSRGLRAAGWDAIDLVVNCGPLQARWAAEHGTSAEGAALLVEQIRGLQPDVVYFHNLGVATAETIRAIRPYARVVAGQIASEPPPGVPWAELDLVVSSFPHLVRELRGSGLAAWYQPLAFDPAVLQGSAPVRDLPLTFVGGLAASHTWVAGTQLLEALAAAAPLEIWGYGAESLAPSSPLRARHRGEAWGADMFALLRRSLVTVNRHGEIARQFANNMRLFEATGCGALLVTDAKDNLAELFVPGEEVVAYRSPEECVALVKHYLANPSDAGAIARAGQERTLREHTYDARMVQTAEILEWHLRAKATSKPRAAAEPPVTTTLVPLTPGAVSQSLLEGWKDPAVPARQRALVETELAALRRGEPVAPFDALAEIGCSSGYYHEVLEYLLGLDLRYTGADYSPSFVDMARRLYPRARFSVADGARLPFRDAAFDVAVSGGVLLHVPNWEEHVAETVRVAGRYVVAHRTPVRRRGPTQAFAKQAYGAGTVELRFAERDLVAAFVRSGVRLVHAVHLASDDARDEHWVSYLFARPGAPVPLA
jgi:SAM-dependent methyltransferase